MVFNYFIKRKCFENQELQIKNEERINISFIFHLPLVLQPEENLNIFLEQWFCKQFM